MNKAAWSPGSGELDFYGRRLAEPVGGASRNGRASVLHDLGRLEEAEAKHRAVLEIRRRVLGPEHSRTLASRDQHAADLHDLGRLEEAEAKHRAVLEIRRRVLGPEHPPRSSGCRSPISPPGFLLWVIVEFSPLR